MDLGGWMMEKICNYPKCYSCEHEYCIKEEKVINKLPPTKQDRREYYKRWYEKNKIESIQYVRWVEVKKILNKEKKQIGTVNYELLMGEITKLEKKCLGTKGAAF